ncbi:MAG: aldo/keto reductase [Thermacetogeniaceae bacterium]
MEYRFLGKTGLKVSRLCFGTLTIGPLQANLPLAKGVDLLRYAVRQGVNFFDTAEIYGTYPYLKQLLRLCRDEELIVATKTYSVTAEEMRKSLEKARRDLDRDWIDIFLLHEQESALTIRGHKGALEFLVEAKQKGLVKAIGISTHRVAGVQGALEFPEIDVIHPLFNVRGLGIFDGAISDMTAALEAAYARGKGVYLMKPLGGGHLRNEAEEALRFAFKQRFAASVAVGMQTLDEVDFNVRIANELSVPEALKIKVSREQRKLHIDEWCEGCGRCVDSCQQGALFLKDGKANVDESKCILCGYCAAACPFFYIKVY